MGDLLGSLIWGAKSEQYCVIGGGSLQMVSEQFALGTIEKWKSRFVLESRDNKRALGF